MIRESRTAVHGPCTAVVMHNISNAYEVVSDDLNRNVPERDISLVPEEGLRVGMRNFSISSGSPMLGDTRRPNTCSQSTLVLGTEVPFPDAGIQKRTTFCSRSRQLLSLRGNPFSETSGLFSVCRSPEPEAFFTILEVYHPKYSEPETDELPSAVMYAALLQAGTGVSDNCELAHGSGTGNA